MKTKGKPESLTPAEIRRYYDERFAGRPLRAREGFYAWMAHAFAGPERGRVLDIACGGGYLLREMQGRGCDLHGCDISLEALRVAAGEVPQGHFAAADAASMPYPDSSFDAAYNVGSLEHFLDMEAALAEMRRILKPRGRAVVMVPNSRYIGDLWRRATFRGGADHHQLLERFGTRREWKNLLESSGFVVESVFPYNKFKAWLRLVPLAFAYCFVFVCSRK
jgi:ubiquinone/menaquinone biosynthesis C-methylase UbiE